MSRKTRKLKEKIERIRKYVMYHLSNVRILLNNPSLLQVEELKFQYGFFPVRETISGSVRKIERIKDEVKNDNVVAEGVSFGTFSGEEYKFPKEELISTEYHVSKHAPVNMLDNKNAISLPEHWYIQVTKDNKVILTDYLKNHKQRYEQFSEHWYASFQCGQVSFFHSDSKEAGHSTLQPRNGYTEVTTEMVKNYMKTWHNINSLVDKDWIQFKANKDGATGNTPIYSPEHLEAKKALFDSNNVNKDNMKLELSEEDKKAIVECINEKKEILKLKRDFYDKYFKETVDKAFEARIHKVPDRWVVVKVKEGSIIIPPGTETQILVKGTPIPDHIGVGDFKKRADALEKCTDQECKPIEELPKTLESLDKIYSFIGLREKSAITNGNKDIIFMKTNNYLNSGRVGYFNTQKPNLMYSPFEMLSDWKSNYVKPLD